MIPFTLPIALSLFSLLGLYVEVRNAVNIEKVHIPGNDSGLKSSREYNFYTKEKEFKRRETLYYKISKTKFNMARKQVIGHIFLHI